MTRERDDDGVQPGRIIPLPVRIRLEEVLHFLGYPPGREPSARLRASLDTSLPEARSRARARGAYTRLPPEDAFEIGLEPGAGPPRAAGLLLGMVTAGLEIEEAAAQALRAGDATRALLLEAAGSAAAEEAADRLTALALCSSTAGAAPGAASGAALDAAPGAGLPAGGSPDGLGDDPSPACRISPGYDDWPLESQREIFARLPWREMGITLLPSFLMLPRKSITFALWLGAGGRPVPGAPRCAACRMRPCPYQRG